MIDPQVAILVCTLELTIILLASFFGSFAAWVAMMNDAAETVGFKIFGSSAIAFIMLFSVSFLMQLYDAVPP